MLNHPGQVYADRITKFTSELSSIKKKLLFLSVIRFISFILIFFFLFNFLEFKPGLSITISVLFFIFFLYMVKKYTQLNQKKEYLVILVKINEDEKLCLMHIYSQFEDGSEYIAPDHPFSFDLDVFGQGSLFQYINRTVTINGKKKLANWLSSGLTNIESINARQKAVKELIPELELRQAFYATGKLSSDKESAYDDIQSWLSQPDTFQKKIFKVLAYILPALSALAVILTIIDIDFGSLLVILFLLQLFVVGTQITTINRIHSVLSKKADFLKKTEKLLLIIEKVKFQSDNLKQLQQKLKENNIAAHSAIDKFSSLVSAFDYRLNLIMGFLLNGFLLWDFQCVLRIDKWKNKYKNSVKTWFEVIGEFEAYCSFSSFAYNNPSFTFPIAGEDVIINFKNAGHPLIPEKERVNNSLEINKKSEFIIITGANMAGKSTFLRTIGLNLLLASNGAPICAESLMFTPLNLFSSMRTSDSLAKNESYFYAELKRLKIIIESLKKGENLFIILDEILKGTNSEDKQKGSKAVLEQIIKLKGTGLIATHDLELAKIERDYPENIKNKCFEIEIDGSEIYFDYKLYDGITKKMNASLLMKQMGILPEKQ